ncbi:MAG TPA: right-handed parallel beta-helix repeat-containing protein, partial [Chloroflexia bacterium]|nr:right-handed parallel beta-helix repeat-containing protein [Chloroflexia bacterium]
APSSPGSDTINFNIGGSSSVKTIAPARPLPTITESVTIDGYSQGSATTTTSDDARENTLAEGNDAVLKVQLNGANAGPAHGLVIQASESTIKGLVINRFAGNGVSISGSGATGNKVLGNFVGTNAAGTETLGNGQEGVEISDASDNTVGGARAAARNVISGNTDDGVELQGDTLDNEILGNFVGTTANGIEALGNGNDGVHILGEGNTVGGTAAGTRNVISGNGGDGVDIQGLASSDNRIEGNFIGTQASSTQDLGNGEDGVNIRDGAFDTMVGGTASGAANRIAHNGQDGVAIASSGIGNSILSNVIFSNTDLGIDLGTGGVTANDLDDPDCASSNNRCQNFPVIASATRSNMTGFTTITGTLNSNPSQNFTVQCFVAAPDPSGFGEGQIPVGQDTTVATDINGDASFSCPANPIPQVNQTVTATATNTATGDTSEFSQNVGVVAGL